MVYANNGFTRTAPLFHLLRTTCQRCLYYMVFGPVFSLFLSFSLSFSFYLVILYDTISVQMPKRSYNPWNFGEKRQKYGWVNGVDKKKKKEVKRYEHENVVVGLFLWGGCILTEYKGCALWGLGAGAADLAVSVKFSHRPRCSVVTAVGRVGGFCRFKSLKNSQTTYIIFRRRDEYMVFLCRYLRI